ncbi:hypothetical protein DVH05_002506 [Phytophthora capsici]|nr:hypothetical protein DVH05_002506 [Phytophthora capsici]
MGKLNNELPRARYGNPLQRRLERSWQQPIYTRNSRAMADSAAEMAGGGEGIRWSFPSLQVSSIRICFSIHLVTYHIRTKALWPTAWGEFCVEWSVDRMALRKHWSRRFGKVSQASAPESSHESLTNDIEEQAGCSCPKVTRY